MKALHRTKALAAYDGARLALKNDMAYPAYILLKEAARGVLSYTSEDMMGIDISDKTKLSRLIDMAINEENAEDMEVIRKLIEAEQGGLESILSMPMDELQEIKKVIKRFIGSNLNEHV